MLPTIRKLSSKRAHFGGNTISVDCVGVADHVLIDSSLNPLCQLSIVSMCGSALLSKNC